MKLNFDIGLNKIAESKDIDILIDNCYSDRGDYEDAFSAGYTIAEEAGDNAVQEIIIEQYCIYFIGSVIEVQQELDSLPNKHDEE